MEEWAQQLSFTPSIFEECLVLVTEGDDAPRGVIAVSWERWYCTPGGRGSRRSASNPIPAPVKGVARTLPVLRLDLVD